MLRAYIISVSLPLNSPCRPLCQVYQHWVALQDHGVDKRQRRHSIPIKTKTHTTFSTTQWMRIVCTRVYKSVHVCGGQRSASGANRLRQGLSMGSAAFGQVGRRARPTDVLPLSPWRWDYKCRPQHMPAFSPVFWGSNWSLYAYTPNALLTEPSLQPKEWDFNDKIQGATQQPAGRGFG